MVHSDWPSRWMLLVDDNGLGKCDDGKSYEIGDVLFFTRLRNSSMLIFFFSSSGYIQ